MSSRSVKASEVVVPATTSSRVDCKTPNGLPRAGPVESDRPSLRLAAGPDQPVQELCRAFHVLLEHQPDAAAMKSRQPSLARVPEIGEDLPAFRSLGDQVVHLLQAARLQQPEVPSNLPAAMHLDQPLVVDWQSDA